MSQGQDLARNKGVTINISQLYKIGVVLASWQFLLCCTLTKDWSERVDHMLQVNCGEQYESLSVLTGQLQNNLQR